MAHVRISAYKFLVGLSKPSLPDDASMLFVCLYSTVAGVAALQGIISSWFQRILRLCKYGVSGAYFPLRLLTLANVDV
jgi:hypothetical protein